MKQKTIVIDNGTYEFPLISVAMASRLPLILLSGFESEFNASEALINIIERNKTSTIKHFLLFPL